MSGPEVRGPGPEALPPALLARIYAHARAAFPHECCGYLVGPRDARDGAVDEAIACTNAAASATAYAIDGRELVALVRSLAGPRPARVIYHSHTHGRAYFSQRDRDVAATAAGPIYPVAHLVVGVTAGAAAAAVTEAALFAWDAAAASFAEVARWAPC